MEHHSARQPGDKEQGCLQQGVRAGCKQGVLGEVHTSREHSTLQDT